MVEVKERGNIFFFYRPKVEADDATDVQRFYMILQTEDTYRLLIVGRKKLPKDTSQSKANARNWAWIREITSKSSEIEDILSGGEYETKTKGTQHLPPAAPVGEGRYALISLGDTSVLAYCLKREKSEEIRYLFNIQKEASLIIAVKNPEVNVEGFPDASPDFPKKLQGRFKNRRWLPLEDAEFLNYADAQLVLISAGDEMAAQELGIEIKSLPEANFLSDIDLDLPDKALMESTFPKLSAFKDRHHEMKDVRFGEGGRKGGKQASKTAKSASGLAFLLSGIELPKKKEGVIDFAKKHASRAENTDYVLNVMEKIDDKEYKTIADIQKAVSHPEGSPPFVCNRCGADFETQSELEHHLQTSHPEQAVSTADIQKTLSGITYPSNKKDIIQYAHKQEAEDKVIDVIKQLPDKDFQNAADVSVAFQESITGEESELDASPTEKAMRSDSAAAIAEAMKGIELPGSKEDLIAHAEKKNARKEIMEVLHNFPDDTFEDMSDIAEAVGKVKD